jgi:hypothetical protein
MVVPIKRSFPLILGINGSGFHVDYGFGVNLQKGSNPPVWS